MNNYRPEDFDKNGLLRARRGIWCVLILQSHAWWLMALELSLSEGRGKILSLIYPTESTLVAGLIGGLSVFVFLFLYPLREKVPRAMMVSYLLLFLVSVGESIRTAWELYVATGSMDEDMWLSLMLLNLGCVVELFPDPYNQRTFFIGNNKYYLKI